MTFDRTISAMLLVMALVIAIPSVLYYRRITPPVLTSTEKELAAFASQPVALSPPQRSTVFSGLISPVALPQATPGLVVSNRNVTSPVAPQASARSPLPNPARTLGSLPKVSVISSDGARRTAIVGNSVVTEGSELDGGRIVKIEENRVLMRRAGKNIWLTIE